jgi:O-6-methylguanine DNA methyltransferase
MKPYEIVRKLLTTAFGEFVAFGSDQGICALEPPLPRRQTLIHDRLRRWNARFQLTQGRNPHIDTVEIWLATFFRGGFGQLPQLSLDLKGTPFELAVWEELRRIPAGKTVSYSDLARRLDKPSAARAVGGAVGKNPIAIVVPCHRVIGKNRKLTGYGGGIERKGYLLAHESSHIGMDIEDLSQHKMVGFHFG